MPKIFGTTETSKTHKYCQILEQFFDCLNVRSLGKNQKKVKPCLKRYINENDKRFSWMTNQFLSYPNTWQKILKRGQVISFIMLDLKCLSVLQTYHGIQITVRSITKAVKILLQNGCIFVLIYFYLLQLESRKMYFTVRNIQEQYNSWIKVLTKLFQNQKLESELNDFQRFLIVIPLSHF